MFKFKNWRTVTKHFPRHFFHSPVTLKLRFPADCNQFFADLSEKWSPVVRNYLLLRLLFSIVHGTFSVIQNYNTKLQNR